MKNKTKVAIIGIITVFYFVLALYPWTGETKVVRKVDSYNIIQINVSGIVNHTCVDCGKIIWIKKPLKEVLEEDPYVKIQEFWNMKGEHICDEKQSFLDFYCEGY